MSEVPLRCIPSTQTISGLDINPLPPRAPSRIVAHLHETDPAMSRKARQTARAGPLALVGGARAW
jgi:hypothetical protein